MPADGRIIRGFNAKKSTGIDIGAGAGSPVVAAANGTVAAITKDTAQMLILVVRHADNILTIYANIDDIKVAKGDKVKRGQSIAVVRAGTPAFLHFEVRNGADAVDPMPYLE
jgi:murein DD-endopeptidase MepM/ murein hydrolase activator NlpD